MTLKDAITRICEFDEAFTIYAAQPWTPDAIAIVDLEPDEGGKPEAAARLNLSYFLETSIAGDFIEDWKRSLENAPTEAEICQRLIDYAVNDA